MGITYSKEDDEHMLSKDLTVLRTIVTAVVDENDLFKDNDYNFLSEDVCAKYQVILESDLNKMMKLEVKSLGETLLIIPREDEEHFLNRKGFKKNEICTRIANHYIRILYVLCLIKYVYNLEQHGDLSIAGIIFRHITVTSNTFKMDFCKLPQKDLKRNAGIKALNLDLSELEGFKFFVEYFLDKQEADLLVRTIKHILARKEKAKVHKDFCDMNSSPELADIFKKRFDSELKCIQTGGDVTLQIPENNPIFNGNWCYSKGFVTIPLSERDGRDAVKLYNEMRQRYTDNVKAIELILTSLVEKKRDGKWKLKDITKDELDKVIVQVKHKISLLYIQSIADFQYLLDRVRTFPNAIVG